MTHYMNLHPQPFSMIANGNKTIELRLFDEKRQQIKIGDTIKFLKEPELNESFKAKVVDLLRYNSFEDMFKDFDISVLSDKSMTKEELMNIIGCSRLSFASSSRLKEILDKIDFINKDNISIPLIFKFVLYSWKRICTLS